MGFDRQQADFIFNTGNNRQPALDILETQFGVPGCMTELAEGVLNLLPSPILGQFNKALQAGKKNAQDWIKAQKRELFLALGIIEVETETGTQLLINDFSNSVLGEGTQSFLDGLNAIGQILGIAQEAWTTVNDAISEVEAVIDCFDQLLTSESLQKSNSALAKDYANVKGYCKIDGVKDLSLNEAQCNLVDGAWYPGTDPDLIKEYRVDLEKKYATERLEIVNALGFVAQVETQTNTIDTILTNRFNDPKKYPEPCFNGDVTLPDGTTVGELLSNTNFCVVDPQEGGYCSLGQRYKDKQACEAVGGVWTEVAKKLPQESFSVKPVRLDPPLSTKGKFILTKTGIYYDSVRGGIEVPDNLEELVECSTIVPPDSMRWMFDYDPNCGGRGESVTLKQFNEWANTVFDIENSVVEENPDIQAYYKEDRFLQQLIGERNRHLYDLSSYLQDLTDSYCKVGGTKDFTVTTEAACEAKDGTWYVGYGEDSALYVNQRQSIIAQQSLHENKITRRKKQIQICVLLGGFEKGEIPINDFSFLNDRGITIPEAAQSNLIFNPGEVSSVVLPIDTKLAITSGTEGAPSLYIEHLLVPPIGQGAIISSPSSIDGSGGSILSLTNGIVTTELIACYDFLNGNITTVPNSTVYEELNVAVQKGTETNAQLVGSSFDFVYPSGVGIPYFGGICSFASANPVLVQDQFVQPGAVSSQLLQSPYKPLSYMRLPSQTDSFESLLYRKSGFTIDTWVHVPTLASSTGDGETPLGWDNTVGASSLHRIILGNENRGGDYTVTDLERLETFQDLNSVKGLLMGFTRDRRFTKNLPPSNLPVDNPVDEDLKFYLAPTRSVNTSSVTFIPRASLNCCTVFDTLASLDNPNGYRYLGAILPVSAGTEGNKIRDCSSTFQHIVVTANPKDQGTVKIYCNGKLLLSQGYIDTFGFKNSPNIPSPVDSSSFYYKTVYPDLPKKRPEFVTSGISRNDFWHWDQPSNGRYTPWIVGGGYTDGMTNVEFGQPYWSSDKMNFLGTDDGGLRSGLQGFLGSFKLYKRDLTSDEVLKNYNTQRGFFKNIET